MVGHGSFVKYEGEWMDAWRFFVYIVIVCLVEMFSGCIERVCVWLPTVNALSFWVMPPASEAATLARRRASGKGRGEGEGGVDKWGKRVY